VSAARSRPTRPHRPRVSSRKQNHEIWFAFEQHKGFVHGNPGSGEDWATAHPQLSRAHAISGLLLLSIIAVVSCRVPSAEAAPTRPLCPAGENLLWQTNAGGDDIHVIDYCTGRLVRRLPVGANPHGIATPKDQSVVYVSLEMDDRDTGEVVFVDSVTYKITARVAVGREPHAIATTPDGRWIYVPCRDGHYWVIDVHSKKVVKKIETGGRPHNTTASHDGRWMYLSPMGGSEAVFVVDVSKHEIVGQIPFSDSVRPPAITSDNRFFFQQVDGLNGFQVADIGTRAVFHDAVHNGSLGWFNLGKLGTWSFSGLKRCHGLGVRPDQSEVWSVCAEFLNVHDLSRSRGFPATHQIELPGRGYWLTFSRDSQFAFIALADLNEVAMIDTNTKKLLQRFKVAAHPKRNIVLGHRYR